MSNLLKEAIIDAKALKEAALKNAEATIIDKYSTEFKETLDKLLEQDDLDIPELGAPAEVEPEVELSPPSLDDADLDMGSDLDPAAPEEEVVSDEEVPLAAVADLAGSDAPEGDAQEFDLNLGMLEEAISELQASMKEAENIDITEEDVADAMSEAAETDDIEIVEEDADTESLEEDAIDDQYAGATAPGLETAAQQDAETKQFAGLGEDLDLDNIVDAVAEALIVDMRAELSGWAGRSSDDMHLEMEREFARRRSTDLQDNLENLKKAQEEVVFENKQLKQQLSQYKQATTELKENLQDVNLSNARLLYTNRILRNTSLNERQKETIVEAISNAGSVTEARTIFDTLQSTAQSTPKRGPKSLSEAITRNRSSVIRASRRDSDKGASSDPFQDRLKKLAGIKS